MATASRRTQSRKTRGAARKDEAGRMAEFLLDLSHQVAACQTLDERLEKLVEIAGSAVDAERGSLFLRDGLTGELYSRVALGNYRREIRVLNNKGIAGWVFTTGKGLIVHDAYADDRFDPSVDEKTGFKTRSVLCTPVRTLRGEIIGVAQALNKKKGRFTKKDLAFLDAMTSQASVFLQSAMIMERMERAREQEAEFLRVVSEVSSEIQLGPLLQKIMEAVTKMLNSERSTLFLNDEKTNELYTEIGQGLGATKIRFPNHLGIAGAVFQSGKSVNIPYAYADLRFNPTFDKQTGFFTRSILCVPVINKDGKTIGVTQVLNRRGGPFTGEDEARLKAFTAQISIGLENAKLFDDVQTSKNYIESVLESMSNGVVTIDPDGKIVTCNAAGLRIFRAHISEVEGQPSQEFFTGPNEWLLEKLEQVEEDQDPDVTMDAELEFGGEKVSVNLTVMPLMSGRDTKLGTMMLIEDISAEKRVKSTMARYMDPSLADRLLASGEEILGGLSSVATVLFSDIRSFTTLTEELGPQGTVQLLNEYFTLMVECIQQEGGMLDKFIGDAIMAVFGTPLPHEDDEDRAVRAGIAMLRSLGEFNADRQAHGKKPVDMGIGINTDEIVSGNIGSPKRMDYTVIGDGVNLAARLESACKQYGAQLLISENTYRKLHGIYQAREVDLVVVKGKTQPVSIYELLDFHTDQSFPNRMEVLNHFKSGVKHYRGGKFAAAIKSFEEALALHPGDKLAEIYIERCRHYQSEPPPKDWGGVWTMKSK